MQWLVNIDRAVSDGLIAPDSGAALKSRARDAMVAFAIDLALFAGIVMVVIGAIAWAADPRALLAVGVLMTVLGLLGLLAGQPRLRLPSNATAAIGITLAALVVSGGANIFFPPGTVGFDPFSPLQISLVLGLPIAIAGFVLRRTGPKRLSMFSGWVILIGAALHILGLARSGGDQAEMFLVYTAAVTFACGTALNVRVVTALALLPLAASLSSRTFYMTGTYSIAIYEVTLTIAQMGLVAVLAFTAAARFHDRYARHCRLLGLLALIWVNVSFWIGSLWGDVVGLHLWGPRWNSVTDGLADWQSKWQAWREAVSKFEHATLVIPADLFAVAWALLIAAAIVVGAVRAQRGVLNLAATFGAIHFYTQYFERYGDSPESFLLAGVIAIFAAWGLWFFNRRLVHRHQTR